MLAHTTHTHFCVVDSKWEPIKVCKKSVCSLDEKVCAGRHLCASCDNWTISIGGKSKNKDISTLLQAQWFLNHSSTRVCNTDRIIFPSYPNMLCCAREWNIARKVNMTAIIKKAKRTQQAGLENVELFDKSTKFMIDMEFVGALLSPSYSLSFFSFILYALFTLSPAILHAWCVKLYVKRCMRCEKWCKIDV